MITTITPQQAHQWLSTGTAILIDVREPDEFASEHLPGAWSIPLKVLPQVLATLPVAAGQNLVFQCQSGRRGGQACALVQALPGFPHTVYNLADGLAGWKNAGLPTISTGTGLSLFRQVQIIVGGAVVLAVLVGFVAHWPVAFALAGLLGAALATAGLTGWCGLAMLLAKMPWNTKTALKQA
jgi:rhodanese-related sulfurtransferase